MKYANFDVNYADKRFVTFTPGLIFAKLFSFVGDKEVE